MGAPSRPDDRAGASLVVLAAGRSSRMGEPKGLVRVEGRAWIERQLDAVALVPCVGRVVVVLGRDRARYEAEAPELFARATVVDNPDPDRGPFSSLQCGLAALAVPDAPAGHEDEGAGGGARTEIAAFVLPVDVPAAAPEVWAALAVAMAPTAFTPSASPPFDAAAPRHAGRGGHPVLLSAALAARLREAPDPAERRLDRELAAARVARIDVNDPRVGLNLNAPPDWGKIVGR